MTSTVGLLVTVAALVIASYCPSLPSDATWTRDLAVVAVDALDGAADGRSSAELGGGW